MFAGHVIGVDPVTEPMLDRDGFALLAFDELVAGGYILDSPRTMGEVLDRFREAGGRGALPDGNFLAGGNREEIYTEMYAGLITPRSIGANLFTGAQYEGRRRIADRGLRVRRPALRHDRLAPGTARRERGGETGPQQRGRIPARAPHLGPAGDRGIRGGT